MRVQDMFETLGQCPFDYHNDSLEPLSSIHITTSYLMSYFWRLSFSIMTCLWKPVMKVFIIISHWTNSEGANSMDGDKSNMPKKFSKKLIIVIILTIADLIFGNWFFFISSSDNSLEEKISFYRLIVIQ